MSAVQTTGVVSYREHPEQADAVLDVVQRFICTGHTDRIDVDAPAYFDGLTLAGSVYVTGYKRAALDRCALVSIAGEIEWIR